MNNIQDRIERLERKLCCGKTVWEDALIDFPLVGKEETLYVDKSTGAIYIWNGSEYVVYGGSVDPQNGLRTLLTGEIEQGSDSISDPKGSELLHDTYTHLDTFSQSYIGKNGLDTFELKITPQGDLRQLTPNKFGSTTGNTPMSFQGLSDKAISFNFNNTTTYSPTPNTNNDVFTMGWNLDRGGSAEVLGKTGIGLSFENHYEPSTGYDLAEKHLFFIDKLGVQHRLESYTIDKDNPATWEKYHTIARSYYKNPITNNKFFEVSGTAEGLSMFTLIGANENEAKKMSFQFNAASDYFGIHGGGLDTNKFLHTFEISGFSNWNTEIFSAIVYPSVATFNFKSPLFVANNNLQATIGGIEENGLYRDSRGFVKIKGASVVDTIPSYATTAAAAADGALIAGSQFKVTNGDGTSQLHIKD